MAISGPTAARILISVTDRTAGREIIDALNSATASAVQDNFLIPLFIIATNVSTTIDFGGLVVGDRVVHIGAVAGNSVFVTVVTAGTLPIAAVVGDLYIVYRVYAPTAASTQGF
jgi:Na+-transporting methylmalonyl-CoA/oxaloacetate decarboxylase beta subunit